LESFLALFPILPFSESAAEEFGRVQAGCRKMGRKVPQIDAQIAAIARTHDCTLLTADRHFDGISGLSIENWLN
jgi:tRNA(fMet)-specific endonuclease VapC